MSKPPRSPTPSGRADGDSAARQARALRQAELLRDNLRRRKQQQRGRVPASDTVAADDAEVACDNIRPK